MQESLHWESCRSSDGQEISFVLWNQNVHYPIHNSSPQVPVLSQMNPVHAVTSYFCEIHLVLSSHWYDHSKPLKRTVSVVEAYLRSSVEVMAYVSCGEYSSLLGFGTVVGWTVLRGLRTVLPSSSVYEGTSKCLDLLMQQHTIAFQKTWISVTLLWEPQTCIILDVYADTIWYMTAISIQKPEHFLHFFSPA